MKQGWIAAAIDELLAAANAGDDSARARARTFAFETYPAQLREAMNAAARERLFHQIDVLLGAFETAARDRVAAAANAAAEKALADLKR
jgi:hypothetical protein